MADSIGARSPPSHSNAPCAFLALHRKMRRPARIPRRDQGRDVTRDIGPDRKIDDDDNRDGTAGHDVHADADGGATNRSALERADTIPATLVTPPPSGLAALYDDDAFK